MRVHDVVSLLMEILYRRKLNSTVYTAYCLATRKTIEGERGLVGLVQKVVLGSPDGSSQTP